MISQISETRPQHEEELSKSVRESIAEAEPPRDKELKKLREEKDEEIEAVRLQLLEYFEERKEEALARVREEHEWALTTMKFTPIIKPPWLKTRVAKVTPQHRKKRDDALQSQNHNQTIDKMQTLWKKRMYCTRTLTTSYRNPSLEVVNDVETGRLLLI